MRIAMIGLKGIPSVQGGVERHVEELSVRFTGMGHTVTVYNRRGYTDKTQKQYRGMRLVRIFTFNNKFLEAPVYSFLATVHALMCQDIIHYHAIGPSFAAFLPRIFGKKIVVTVHGLDWQRAKWGRFARACLRLCETASVVFPHRTIVVSDKLKRYLAAKYQSRSGKITTIANGVSSACFLEPNRIRSRYGLEKNTYILFLARLVPEKGCHVLLEAFRRLDPDVKLVVAGGSSHSEEYCAKLRRYGSDKIIFTGEVQGDLVCELYSNALFYVLPSEVEGLPIGLLEAMSYGLGPLVSNIDENQEVLDRIGGFGYSFRCDDAADLSEKLRYMLAHPIEVSELGKAAKTSTERFYNWQNIAVETERVYLSIWKDRSKRSAGHKKSPDVTGPEGGSSCGG